MNELKESPINIFIRLCFSKTCLHSGLRVTYFIVAILYLFFYFFELSMFKIIPPPPFLILKEMVSVFPAGFIFFFWCEHTTLTYIGVYV